MRFHSSSTLLSFASIALIFLAGLTVASSARAQVEIYSDQQHYLLGEASRVAVNLSFGEVQVEGNDGSQIVVELKLTCSRADLDKCRRRGEKIRVIPRIKKGKFVIALKHTPRGRIQGLKAQVKVSLPNNVPLSVDMVGGDVFVARMLSDVSVDGGGADVDIVAQHDQIGDVKVKVMAGKAELWMGDGHMKGSGIPRSIRWRGPGASKIDIDLGTGDARVRLE